MKKVHFLVIIVCVASVIFSSLNISAIQWEGLDTDVPSDSKQTVNSLKADEMQLMATVNNASLSYNPFKQELVYKAFGEEFSSTVSPDYAGIENENESRKFGELFSFTLFNKQNRSTKSFLSSDTSVNVQEGKVKNGFSLEVKAEEVNFRINFVLENNNLLVSIPYSGISENDEKLVSVTLLPFFGACNSHEDGYIFYPDGCGTLYYFKDKPVANSSAVTKLIYSDAINELDEYMEGRNRNITQLTVPVFGIKKGNTALFAQIEDGAADTALTLAPKGYIYQLARVYPTFHYRYSYFEKTVSGEEELLFNEASVKTDFSVRYSLLSGEKATYIEMAKAVREEIFGDAKEVAAPNLSVDIFMTTKKSLLLWNVTKTVTTFKDVKRFLEAMDNSDVKNVRLNLLGWQSDGYNNYPSHLPVSRRAGGLKDLQSLVKSADKRGASVFLTENYAEGNFKRMGFSLRRRAAYNMQNKPLTDTEETKILLDINKEYNKFSDNMTKLKKTGVSGLSFDLFGALVYDNVARGRVLRRQDYIDKVNDFLIKSNGQLGTSAVDGANCYAFKNAGYVYNLPSSSSREFIYDEDVPFLQIVLHGKRPYSGDTYGNFANSPEKTVLEWLEYGYVPSFVLGSRESDILRGTFSEGFTYSQIDDWKSRIIDLYKDYINVYSHIKSQEIEEYVKIGNVRKITYKNQHHLFINYGDEAVEIDGVNIEPISYFYR